MVYLVVHLVAHPDGDGGVERVAVVVSAGVLIGGGNSFDEIIEFDK